MGDCEEDKDMQAMAYEELEQALKEEQKLHNLLLKSLLPKDDADVRDCILEVRAGNTIIEDYSVLERNTKSYVLNLIVLILHWGPEAKRLHWLQWTSLNRHSQKKGWRFEVVEVTDSNMKGFKEASAAISGADVYGKLKFESGVHRVKIFFFFFLQFAASSHHGESGRVHTSAMSVAILPQADEVIGDFQK
ncbi:putative peptide chain release factor [Helianthus annuus]|nr:putative peptide chain release factor [Helianthus annuus]KAJ0647658.1 putative peptide chain release factor [Helianthus annuus]